MSPAAARVAAAAAHAGLPLGVGGIGRAQDAGLATPPDLIYAQYPRLGATAALISRSFLAGGGDLAREIRHARERLAWWAGRPRASSTARGATTRGRARGAPGVLEPRGRPRQRREVVQTISSCIPKRTPARSIDSSRNQSLGRRTRRRPALRSKNPNPPWTSAPWEPKRPNCRRERAHRLDRAVRPVVARTGRRRPRAAARGPAPGPARSRADGAASSSSKSTSHEPLASSAPRCGPRRCRRATARRVRMREPVRQVDEAHAGSPSPPTGSPTAGAAASPTTITSSRSWLWPSTDGSDARATTACGRRSGSPPKSAARVVEHRRVRRLRAQRPQVGPISADPREQPPQRPLRSSRTSPRPSRPRRRPVPTVAPAPRADRR